MGDCISAYVPANDFHIFNCVFENSVSFNGGGMIVEFMNSVQNNTVSVNQTSFSGNSCLETHADKSSGGGLVLGFMFYPASWVHKSWPPMGNSFKCSYCTFEEKQCLYIWVVEQGYTPQKTSFVTPISSELFSPTVTGQTTGLLWEQLCLLRTPGICDYSAESMVSYQHLCFRTVYLSPTGPISN